MGKLSDSRDCRTGANNESGKRIRAEPFRWLPSPTLPGAAAIASIAKEESISPEAFDFISTTDALKRGNRFF